MSFFDIWLNLLCSFFSSLRVDGVPSLLQRSLNNADVVAYLSLLSPLKGLPVSVLLEESSILTNSPVVDVLK
jgi:hypothetical protein